MLCGAFVASKSSTPSKTTTTTTTTTPSIPRLPDDVRAASATVLENIFRDAGVGRIEPTPPPGSSALTRPDPVVGGGGAAAVASWTPSSWTGGPAWTDHVTTVVPDQGQPSSQMVGLTASSLDVLQRQLLQPSRTQEEAQAFSLTVDQYQGLVGPDPTFLRSVGVGISSSSPSGPGPSSIGPMPMSQGRRDLNAQLAAMRDRNRHPRLSSSAADVYTRSLLWDQVPVEVVREFARFVSHANPHHHDQHLSTGVDDGGGVGDLGPARSNKVETIG